TAGCVAAGGLAAEGDGRVHPAAGPDLQVGGRAGDGELDLGAHVRQLVRRVRRGEDGPAALHGHRAVVVAGGESVVGRRTEVQVQVAGDGRRVLVPGLRCRRGRGRRLCRRGRLLGLGIGRRGAGGQQQERGGSGGGYDGRSETVV